MLKVKCYSGYRANERPISFTIKNREILVKEIIDRWYSPGCLYFKVKDENNHKYILKYDETQDLWTLEFFNKG